MSTNSKTPNQNEEVDLSTLFKLIGACLLYTSPSPRD